jgi:putative hemolysin
MVERYGLTLDVIGGSLDNIPRDGPLIVIANHPYGILDGLMMGHILSQTRGDFRILAHQVFRKAEDLNRIILPISFDETKEALALNIETRKAGAPTWAMAARSAFSPAARCRRRPKPFGSRSTRAGAPSPRG